MFLLYISFTLFLQEISLLVKNVIINGNLVMAETTGHISSENNPFPLTVATWLIYMFAARSPKKILAFPCFS